MRKKKMIFFCLLITLASTKSHAQSVTTDTPRFYETTGAGFYCINLNDTGLHIGLNGSDSAVRYDLYFSGCSCIVSSRPGTGLPIDFGLFTANGGYTPTATNTRVSPPITRALYSVPVEGGDCTSSVSVIPVSSINALPYPNPSSAGVIYFSQKVLRLNDEKGNRWPINQNQGADGTYILYVNKMPPGIYAAQTKPEVYLIQIQ